MTAAWSGLAGSVLALAFVLALAWFGLRWLRRFVQPPAAAGAPELRVLRTLVLGPRERLVLVRHGDAELLLGVGAEGVRLLDRRDAGPLAPPPH
ncbi:flagellar biosynthetic protein FliO [Rubrivivax gelatinosus]|uniref:Flagellar protein n=1 Tax=Rubrivivax gelatinosus TaxID=28068 RepID=A0A4R2MG67_RUBGE|nr:flagellar biosynthetic protein FliO [Rubrivivax gelatinosus]TCP05441.1 flagellar biosynthetic protein FliO [Rubrivivax gelatinosus]